MEGNWLYEVLRKNGLTESTSEWLSIHANATRAVLVLIAATLIIGRTLLSVSCRVINANRHHLNDALLKNNFLDRLSWFIPIPLAHFSTAPRWVQFEGIQSDSFDHRCAAQPVFELQPYQNPTGYDLQHFARPASEATH